MEENRSFPPQQEALAMELAKYGLVIRDNQRTIRWLTVCLAASWAIIAWHSYDLLLSIAAGNHNDLSSSDVLFLLSLPLSPLPPSFSLSLSLTSSQVFLLSSSYVILSYGVFLPLAVECLDLSSSSSPRLTFHFLVLSSLFFVKLPAYPS